MTIKTKTFADTDTIQVLKTPTYREGSIRARAFAIFSTSKTIGDARKALDAAGLPRGQLSKRHRDGVIAVTAGRAPAPDNATRVVEESVITVSGAPAVEHEPPAVLSKPKRQRKPGAKKARAA